MTDKYERLVTRLFSERFALTLRKIPKGTRPTPDFDVLAASAHVAVLEVKALESTIPFVAPGEETDDQLLAGLRSDNCASRVAAKVHDAVRQFEGTSLPKVLVVVNDGSEADKFDLQEVLQGFLSTDDGGTIVTLPASARQRAADDRSKIDLYVWIDELSGEAPRLVSASAVGRSLRSRYFAEPSGGSAG